MPLTQKVKFGLFPKFLLSFLLVAIIPMLLIEYLTFSGTKTFKDQLVDRSKSVITDLSTKNIEQKGLSVAKELERYCKLKKLSTVTLEMAKNDPFMREIAVQPVGKTGYTAVHTNEAINVFHKNPKIVGLNLRKLQKKFPNFWKILEKSLKGPSDGYYNWKDIHGKVRKKYMYCTPVKGTNLVVAATTYLDEYFGPMNQLVASANQQQKSTMYYILIVSIGLFIYMIIFSYVYARNMSRPILHLADVADRISVGDLDAKVKVKTSDEIMILADAINRMQKSLKSAIVRLRERRKQERS